MASDARRWEPWWPTLLASFAGFAFALFFVLSFDEPWTLRGDNKAVFYPMTLEAFRGWMDGHVPEWAGIWLGFPLLADPSSFALYWPNLLAFLATPEPHARAYDLATAVHAGLLAGGITRLLQALRVTPGVAIFGGFLAFLAPLHHWHAAGEFSLFGGAVWFPWIFLCAERLGRNDVPTVSGPLVLGWVCLASDAILFPEYAFYAGLFAGVWLLVRGDAPLPVRLGRAAFLGGGGLALAAPQLVPTAFFAPLTTRAGEVPSGVQLLFASPWSFVSFVHATREPVLFLLGTAPILLAAVAVASRRDGALLLLAIFVGTFLFALGDATPVYDAIHSLPVFRSFRNPLKVYPFTEQAIVLLAALGADVLLRRGKTARIFAFALMVVAGGERLLLDAERMFQYRRLPGGNAPRFEALQATLRESGVAMRANEMARPPGPPPRLLESVGAGNLTLAEDLESVGGGLVALLPSEHQALVRPYTDRRLSAGRAVPYDSLGADLILTAGFACARLAASPGLQVLRRGEGWCLLGVESPAPRYLLVPSPSSLRSLADALEPGASGPPTDGAGRPQTIGTVEVASYRPGETRLVSRSEKAGFLFVRESWNPGWSAQVDGRDVPVERVASLFFGVPLPAGQHEVALRYRTPGFRLGVAIAIAWVLGALFAFVWRRRAADR